MKLRQRDEFTRTEYCFELNPDEFEQCQVLGQGKLRKLFNVDLDAEVAFNDIFGPIIWVTVNGTETDVKTILEAALQKCD